MPILWLQTGNRPKAIAAQKTLRCSLSGLGMLTFGRDNGLYIFPSFSSENVSENDNLPGLLETIDHQQLKI